MNAALVPSSILSTSECIAPFAPDTWSLDWVREAREEKLRRFAASPCEMSPKWRPPSA
jgi:hypothetical protein